LLSWNVNGLNALLKRDPNALRKLVTREGADVLFLQETKLTAEAVEDVKAKAVPQGWNSMWSCSVDKKGYAGVAVLWSPRVQAAASLGVGLKEADREGRCLTLDLPGLYAVGCYVPNAGDGLKRLGFRVGKWEPAIARHLRQLEKKKPVIYCGDLNVCHKELDLWGNHAANSKGAGYSPQERTAMSKLLDGNTLSDSFRALHPHVRAFTYWGFRFNAKAKNLGWRLDYCLVSKRLLPRVRDAFMLPDIAGSDHCPIGLVLA
jgi:exodeoxyribonuclease-3